MDVQRLQQLCSPSFHALVGRRSRHERFVDIASAFVINAQRRSSEASLFLKALKSYTPIETAMYTHTYICIHIYVCMYAAHTHIYIYMYIYHNRVWHDIAAVRQQSAPCTTQIARGEQFVTAPLVCKARARPAASLFGFLQTHIGLHLLAADPKPTVC